MQFTHGQTGEGCAHAASMQVVTVKGVAVVVGFLPRQSFISDVRAVSIGRANRLPTNSASPLQSDPPTRHNQHIPTDCYNRMRHRWYDCYNHTYL